MSQHVWHRDDIARIAVALIELAPSSDFAAGVAALARAVGALSVAATSDKQVVLVDGGREEREAWGS